MYIYDDRDRLESQTSQKQPVSICFPKYSDIDDDAATTINNNRTYNQQQGWHLTLNQRIRIRILLMMNY